MLRNALLAFCVLCAVVLIGCNKTETMSSNSNSKGNSNSSTSTTDKPMTKSTPETTTASTSGEKIGIPECDDYIAKYETCLRGKVPEMVRPQLENALKQSRDNWKKAAANEQSRGTLAAACKQASDAAAASMKAYGCAW